MNLYVSANSIGIFKSTDGGSSFVASSVGFGNIVNGRFAVHPLNSSTLSGIHPRNFQDNR